MASLKKSVLIAAQILVCFFRVEAIHLNTILENAISVAPTLTGDYLDFCSRHGRSHKSKAEFDVRFTIYTNNINTMVNLNKKFDKEGKDSKKDAEDVLTLGANFLTDWTD